MAPNATHAPVEMLADCRCGLAPSQARHVSEVQASVSPPGHRRVTAGSLLKPTLCSGFLLQPAESTQITSQRPGVTA